MSKLELIAQELEGVSEQDLDKLLALVRALKEKNFESTVSLLAAESALAKDWLTPEEDVAWANL